MSTRDAIALSRLADHEAAHATVAQMLGLKVRSVEVGADLESGVTWIEYREDTDVNLLALLALAPAAFDNRPSDGDEDDFTKLCERDPTLRQRRQHLIAELQRMRRETDADKLHDFFRCALISHRRIVRTGGGDWEAAP
jgi:hypothetical protein